MSIVARLRTVGRTVRGRRLAAFVCLIGARIGSMYAPMVMTLLAFGFGYSARALGARLMASGDRVIGTTRDASRVAASGTDGAEMLRFPAEDLRPVRDALNEATHVLISAGPNEHGDPVLGALRDVFEARASALDWVGYLSSTAVYGDRAGGWVDEGSPVTPTTERGRRRARAERAWLDIPELPIHVFRLAGIYGPGRGPISKLRKGTARRIVKEGQVFNRIHVDDIAETLLSSMRNPRPGAIYNLCDDHPAPPEDVVSFAAQLLGLAPPPLERFEDAELTPMARSFYAENKRVTNDLVKRELGTVLRYPTYREGLCAVLEAEDAPPE